MVEEARRCTRSGEDKPTDSFARRRPGRRQSWCRRCRRAWDRDAYRGDATRRAAVRESSTANKGRNRAFPWSDLDTSRVEPVGGKLVKHRGAGT